jgi:hypothetical protein
VLVIWDILDSNVKIHVSEKIKKKIRKKQKIRKKFEKNQILKQFNKKKIRKKFEKNSNKKLKTRLNIVLVLTSVNKSVSIQYHLILVTTKKTAGQRPVKRFKITAAAG